MHASRIVALLSAGGMTHGGEPSRANDGHAHLPKYSGLADTRGVEELGQELSRRLRGERPDRVLIWKDIDDISLGHVVARDLDCRIVCAVNADGILDFDGTMGSGNRVVIVSDAFRTQRAVSALEVLVEHAGAEVVAVGALVATPELAAEHRSRATVTLVDQEQLAPADDDMADGGRGDT